MKQILSLHPIFELLTSESRQKLDAASEIREYGDGEYLIRENEPNENLFLVLEGKVCIEGGDGKLIAVLRKGAVIGEISASGISLPVANAIADGLVRVLTLPNCVVGEVAEREPAFGKAMRDLGLRRATARLFDSFP